MTINGTLYIEVALIANALGKEFEFGEEGNSVYIYDFEGEEVED